jgi:regulator of RNase E activity RraB
MARGPARRKGWRHAGSIMSADWDFYLARIDGRPASVFVDLAFGQSGGRERFPHLGHVRVALLHPTADGLTREEETDALYAIEDALATALTAGGRGLYAGRITTHGGREFHFYIDDPAGFASAVAAALAPFAGYAFETKTQDDPEWSVYFGFLHPRAEELDQIMNRRVLASLETEGDRIDQPRAIEHVARFRDRESLDRCALAVRSLGFRIAEAKGPDADSVLTFVREDAPIAIIAVTPELRRLVQDAGGAYEGWGCAPVRT